MNLAEPFIRRPVMTILLMLALFFLGIVALKQLPISDMPNVDYPTIYITAELPGANPEMVAQKVTSILEKELASIKGIAHMSSSSWQGGCYLFLQFHLEKNMSLAAQEVQRAIDKSPLPKDLVQRPIARLSHVSNHTALYAILSSSAMGPEQLHHFAAAQLQQPLMLLEGVSEVRLSGASETIEVEIDPGRLAARGLTMQEINQSLQKEGAHCPIGSLEGNFRRIGLYIPRYVQNAQDLANLAVAYHDHIPIRLKDLGSIKEEGLNVDHFRFINREKNETGVLLEIRKESKVNVVQVCKEIRQELERIQSTLPPTHQIKVILDQSAWIQEAIDDLQGNLVLALVLVALIIFLFLRRWQDTLIPCLALPLSLLGTCAVMHVLGYSLDILSLLALTLAMGFVVDDAIVVLENIARLREEGKKPFEAALIGSKQISFTVLSMTCSLIAVFIPLIFMHGIIGKLFRAFSITLSVAIFLSGIISFTLIPMLAARLKGSPQVNRQKKSIFHILFYWYEPSLAWCLCHRKTILGIATLSLLASLWIFTSLPVQILPKEDLGWGSLSIHIPKNLTDLEMEEYQTKIEKIISQDSAVESLASWLDKTGFYIFVRLVEPSLRPDVKKVLKSLQERLEAIPGLVVWYYTKGLISFSLGNTNGQEGHKYMLKSPDLQVLQKVTEELEKEMKKSPLFEKVTSDLSSPSPQLAIYIEKEKADQLGLSMDAIQKTLQHAYTQTSPLILERSGERVPIYLKLPLKERQSASCLEKLSIKSEYGTMIPFKAVASWQETLRPPNIQHIFQLPAATISFTLAKNSTLPQANKLLKEFSQEFPPSIRGEIAGEANAQKSLLRDMNILLLLALLAMYVVLGILYESFIHPITILSSLPFAGLGAGLLLFLCKEPLSLYSFIGLILLIGIVKKNGIMLIDHALQSDKPPEEAIYEACLVRFRPIMMTTLAAFMGALPVALGFGAGGNTRRGLGIAICGGLLFSQMLTLYLTPIVYLYLHRASRKFLVSLPEIKK